jgi:Flp pilus assembly protein TadD
MSRFASILAILVVSTVGGVAQAQTSEINGRVHDTDGKPIVGAEVAVSNTSFPDRVHKGASDKKGNFFVSGLLYEAQAPMWSIAIKADGWVPVAAKIVARDAQKTLYFSDDVKLSAARASTEIPLRGFAEIRIEFTMRPGDAAAEVAPVPRIPTPGAVGTPGIAPEADSYAQAIEKVRAGDSEGSVDLFKKAIEEKPDDWERRDLFAKVLLKLDRQGEATIQANKAAQIAPDKAGPLVTLTDIYLARGLAEKAADAIARAQQLEPESGKVLERAAAVAANAGRIDEAIALNEKIVAAKPDNTEVLVALADLYNRNKQPKKAEEVLNKVVALDPANAHRTFYNLGVVIENRDDASESDHRKAIEAFRKAIGLKPDYAIAHRDLGFALLRTGDLMAASKELQKYVDLDPRAKDAAEIKATVKSLSSTK